MQHTPALPYLREALLFLTLSGILIPLLQKLRMNQVLGFLAVGILLGPHAVGGWVQDWPWLAALTFSDPVAIHGYAELGIVFLMFLIGLELSPELLWSMRRWVFAGGAAQVLLTALLIGSAAWLFGNSVEASVILGLVLSLSSTAIVMQLLARRNGLATPEGRSIFAVLMFQDFAVIPLLILMDMLGKDASGGFLPVLGLALLKSVLAIGVIYLLGSRFIAPLFRVFAHRRQPEVFMALTLLVTLGIAWLTAAAGLSLALGAFLAGMLMAETEYRHEVEVTVEPFKGLLMGLFFMSVGMEIEVGELGRNGALIFASALGLMLIKSAVVAGLFRVGGLRAGPAAESGLLLGQGGEFAFVIVGYALSIGLLPAPTAQFMLLVVSLSMLLTPAAARAGGWIRQRLERNAPAHDAGEPADLPESLRGHLVIAGFGRVGRLIAEVLEKQGLAFVAIEQNARRAGELRQAGVPVFYGNAARPELLAKVHTKEAAALFITMDQPAEAMHTLLSAREANPSLPIYVRSMDEAHAHELRAAGATAVIPETLEASLQLAALALASAGMSDHAVTQAISAERDARI